MAFQHSILNKARPKSPEEQRQIDKMFRSHTIGDSLRPLSPGRRQLAIRAHHDPEIKLHMMVNRLKRK